MALWAPVQKNMFYWAHVIKECQTCVGEISFDITLCEMSKLHLWIIYLDRDERSRLKSGLSALKSSLKCQGVCHDDINHIIYALCRSNLACQLFVQCMVTVQSLLAGAYIRLVRIRLIDFGIKHLELVLFSSIGKFRNG